VVVAGANVARERRSEVVFAIGGGSSIDAAKIIAASATNSEDPKTWVGFSKLKTEALPIYAVPTTSGTGSEATLGAVISDTDTHEKNVIGDLSLLPAATALDSTLLQGMPAAITAATGMDALTHGIEAYVSKWDRGTTQQVSADAVRLIMHNLRRACSQGDDHAARDAMAMAAYYAGMAINQVNVGNVHAIAHQLGGKYGIPHGVANAMVLPLVLDLYHPQADVRLAELARKSGIGNATNSDGDLAATFIAEVRQLRQDVGLPAYAEALEECDFAYLIDRAVAEGDDYPSPVFFQAPEVESVLRDLLPPGAEA
jgi:alcohol dehydrogenase class IV